MPESTLSRPLTGSTHLLGDRATVLFWHPLPHRLFHRFHLFSKRDARGSGRFDDLFVYKFPFFTLQNKMLLSSETRLNETDPARFCCPTPLCLLGIKDWLAKDFFMFPLQILCSCYLLCKKESLASMRYAYFYIWFMLEVSCNISCYLLSWCFLLSF